MRGIPARSRLPGLVDPALQCLVQPGPCEHPVILHRGGGEAHGCRRLFDSQAGKVAQRDDLRLARVDGLELGQRPVDAEHLGRVDVQGRGLAVQLDDDAWDRVIDTNLTAAFRLTRRAVRGMVRRRHGRVINIASVVGSKANAGQANYAASKAGLIGMTKTVAVEVARRGVTVNAIAPGFIATEMTDATARRLGVDIEDFRAAAASRNPVKRVGAPEDIAAAAAFLCSDEASYITGQTLYVDGGAKI